MGLRDIIIRYALTPRVVDRSPGALRVHIPALRQVTPQWRPLTDQVIRLLRIPSGIEAVEPQDKTGNLLFSYDTNVTTEQQVVAYLQGLLSLVQRYADRFTKVPADRMPSVIDRIETFLRDALARDGAIGKDLAIPDDVWD
jgi:hypothetical protein